MSTNHTAHRRGRGLLLRLHRDEQGQALFLVFIYVVLLSCLAFAVFNTGQKSVQKTAVQNAADASVLTGSGWFCRGMNTISMANVTQTQILSTIVLLDSLETTVPEAKRIIDDLLADIGSSPHGSDVPNDPRLQSWFIAVNAREEQLMMQAMQRLMSRIDMDEYCRYDDGVLWQSCYVLSELAAQTVEVAPDMAQREAILVTDENDVDQAFLLPFYPVLPLEPVDRTGRDFRNFRRPMVQGRTPYGRRIEAFRHLHDYQSRRGGRLLGPFEAMREPFLNPIPMGAFELSRFSVLFKVVSDRKLEMLFGSPDDKVGLTHRVETFDELQDWIADNGTDSVNSTSWSRMSFNTRDEYGTPGFHSSGPGRRHPDYPREIMRVYDGYRGPPNGHTRATSAGFGADARHDLWYRTSERRTARYPGLDIPAPHPPRHPDGSDWPYTEAEMTTYWHNSVWRFNGASVGQEDTLHRRYLPPAGRPPRLAPILLARRARDPDERTMYEDFSFVAFAHHDATSLAAPKVFPHPVPTNDKLICYAQAEVYNPTGWDMFTQNWRTQLTMMDHWQWSLMMIDRGPPGDIHRDVAEEMRDLDYEPELKMLNMWRPTFVELVTH